MNIKEVFSDNPVIAAVKSLNELDIALESSVGIIFILFGDLINIKDIEEKVRNTNKLCIIHIDLIEGLASREVSVKYIKERTSFKGIISTKPQVIRVAKALGLIAIQRMFVFDTLSLNNIKNHLVKECDAIEILPGVIPKVVTKIKVSLNKEIIVGGLIETKEEVIMALNSGATCVSTTKKEIWEV